MGHEEFAALLLIEVPGSSPLSPDFCSDVWMDAAAVLSNGVLAFIEKFDVSILLNLQIGTFLYSESVLYSVEYMSLVSSVLVSVTQNISTEYVKSSSIIFFSPKLFSQLQL